MSGADSIGGADLDVVLRRDGVRLRSAALESADELFFFATVVTPARAEKGHIVATLPSRTTGFDDPFRQTDVKPINRC
jgi:hypothetical protein